MNVYIHIYTYIDTYIRIYSLLSSAVTGVSTTQDPNLAHQDRHSDSPELGSPHGEEDKTIIPVGGGSVRLEEARHRTIKARWRRYAIIWMWKNICVDVCVCVYIYIYIYIYIYRTRPSYRWGAAASNPKRPGIGRLKRDVGGIYLYFYVFIHIYI